MQANTRARTPPLSHYVSANQPHHSYASSSEDSYGGLHSHSRSASGTSQTNYDDPIVTPPPRVLMDEYSRHASPTNGHQRQPSDFSKSAKIPMPDQITMHLLLETAVDDCKGYDILSPEQLKDIKKEQSVLSRRIESAKRKLFIESRVHNTAHSLHRLDQNINKSRTSRPTANDSDDPDADPSRSPPTSQKCEELAHDIWKMDRRQTALRDRCLKHTAAVLQLNYQNQVQNKQNQPLHLDQTADDSDDEEVSRQLDFNDGFMDISDSPRNLKPRLQTLGGELYGLISQSGPYSKAGYAKPPEESAGSDDDLTYIEMGLNIIKGLHQELVRYSNDSVEKVRRHEQTNVVLNGLWDVVNTGHQDLKRGKRATRDINPDTRDLDGESDDESEADEDDADSQPFSLQTFSDRVESICNRATTLSQQHVALHEQFAQERELNAAANTDIISQIEAKSVEIDRLLQKSRNVEQLESERSAMEAEITQLQERSQNADKLEGERGNLETEIARLQTELTVARAELDSAAGARQQQVEGEIEQLINKNSELMAEKADIEERVDMLQKELRELVSEYEGMVKQGVDAEKERETLEATVDSLKEKVEEAEMKLSEEKLKIMGKRGSKAVNGEANRATEMTSMGVMRTEFKKMMRDARAEHFRSLRAEQEERRRLEAVIRNMRKDQGSAAAGAASASLSPPPSHGKSGLSKSIAAS